MTNGGFDTASVTHVALFTARLQAFVNGTARAVRIIWQSGAVAAEKNRGRTEAGRRANPAPDFGTSFARDRVRNLGRT
jgi:hypothetical protein